MLNNEEIKSILDHTFEIELGQITLVQGNDEPIVLEGPGNIFQDETGILNLKMYHKFEDDGRILLDKFYRPNRFKSGEIISESEFYRLEATDFFGNKWQAENISRISPNFSIPASGAVFKAKLKEISHQSECPHSDVSIENLYLFGEYDIPVNELEDLGERGKHFNKLRFKANQFEFLFRKFEKGLHLTVTGKKESISLNFENHIIEALSIIFGKIIDPLLIINAQSGIQKIRIRSVDSLQMNSPLPSAILTHPHPEFKGMRTLLGKYIKHFSIRSHKSEVLYGYWHKINRSYQTGIENAALSITVSIEGIIKSFFKNSMHPDINLRNKARISRRLIAKSEIDEDIKNRILTHMGSIGNVSPKLALRRLSSSGYFRNNLVDNWSVLRNKSTHSDKLGKSPIDVQRDLDQTFSCLGLFYFLVFIIIGYKGSIDNYTERGWPAMDFPLKNIEDP